MKIIFSIFLFVLGACFGSFLCCQARRLKLKTTKKGRKLGNRSVCLSCKTQLKWYDNLPIVSWLVLRGKCRKCHHKIGVAEFLSELGVALAFLLLSINFNIVTATTLEWGIFAITLLLTLNLSFLAIYDGLYGELPTFALNISLIFAVIALVLQEYSLIASSGFSPDLIWQPLLSVLILGGLYLLLYFISHGKWVGDGDWVLGVIMGLAIFYPWLALLILFIANLLACVIMLPILKKHKQHKIHFGPFFIAAFVIVYAFAKLFLSMI